MTKLSLFMQAIFFAFIGIIIQYGQSFQLQTFSSPSLSKHQRGVLQQLQMGPISAFKYFRNKRILNQPYDYIIVGGGTAGSVLANRLSEDPNKKVLILEAGSPKFNSKYINIPAGVLNLFKTAIDWNYNSVKEPTTNDREVYLCRGKVLGGSSCINVLLYHRGNEEDYKAWEQATGSSAWNPSNVLPFFKKSQDDYRGESRYHGTGGEFAVSEVPYQNELSKAFLDACKEKNFIENNDFNDWSRSQEGYGRYQVNERNGQRCSAASAFLKPILKKRKKNLKVVTNILVHKINFDETNTKAVSVEAELNNELYTIPLVAENGEVLLSGGAINSPQVLLLSGIGAKEELNKYGIPVKHDLPAVGQHLQDHPAAVVSYSAKPEYSGVSTPSKLRIKGTKILNPKAILQWLLFKKGPLTTVGCDHGGFFKTTPDATSPNVQLRFLAAKALSPDGMSTYSSFRDSNVNLDGFSFQSIVCRPLSEGSVKLASKNPKDYPLIQTGYFTNERDLQSIRDGLKLSRQIAQASPLAKYLGEEVFPGPQVQSDVQFNEYIKSTVHTSNALVGTCRMGKDPKDSVVGPDLKVHGVSNLRVIDASVIPKIPGGQTSAPTIMIAEKASSIIKGHINV